MSSKEPARTRRATRATTSGASSSSSSNQNLTASSTSRPVRSTRSKINHINLEDSSNESDNEDIKPIGSVNIKKNSATKTNGNLFSSSKLDTDKLNKLESLTGLSRTEAIQLLEASNNNLEQAIELHFANTNGSNGISQRNGIKRSINHVEESNSSDSIYNSDDNIRAPIQPKSEKMLDFDPYGDSYEQES